jgi:threonine dehydratase
MAAIKSRDQWRGKKIVCVMSGGNLNTDTLRRILGTS